MTYFYRRVFIDLVLVSSLCAEVKAYSSYKSRIPNGNSAGAAGHAGMSGYSNRNQFGKDFAAAGSRWTTALCQKDSDGDGHTNGAELGDPCCVWTVGATPSGQYYGQPGSSNNYGSSTPPKCQPAAQPVDCVLSSWQNVGSCSETCGGGSQQQSRSITTQPENGGAACGSQTRTVQCNTQACPSPVNCVLSSWYNDGGCSATCGGGSQKQKRYITTQPANGGAACGSLTQTMECNTQACPVDCVQSEWQNVGDCSQTCGGGSQEQQRSITTQPAHGGAICGDSTQTMECNTQACPPSPSPPPPAQEVEQEVVVPEPVVEAQEEIKVPAPVIEVQEESVVSEPVIEVQQEIASVLQPEPQSEPADQSPSSSMNTQPEETNEPNMPIEVEEETAVVLQPEPEPVAPPQNPWSSPPTNPWTSTNTQPEETYDTFTVTNGNNIRFATVSLPTVFNTISFANDVSYVPTTVTVADEGSNQYTYILVSMEYEKDGRGVTWEDHLVEMSYTTAQAFLEEAVAAGQDIHFKISHTDTNPVQELAPREPDPPATVPSPITSTPSISQDIAYGSDRTYYNYNSDSDSNIHSGAVSSSTWLSASLFGIFFVNLLN